jgi:hypothetical protein
MITAHMYWAKLWVKRMMLSDSSITSIALLEKESDGYTVSQVQFRVIVWYHSSITVEMEVSQALQFSATVTVNLAVLA